MSRYIRADCLLIEAACMLQCGNEQWSLHARSNLPNEAHSAGYSTFQASCIDQLYNGGQKTKFLQACCYGNRFFSTMIMVQAITTPTLRLFWSTADFLKIIKASVFYMVRGWQEHSDHNTKPYGKIS